MITLCKKICVPRPPRTRPLGNAGLDHDTLPLVQAGRLPRPKCLNLSAAEGDVNQFRDGLPANKAVIAEATAAQRAQQMPTRDDDPAPGLAERLVTHRALGRGRRDVSQGQGLHRRDVHVDHHRGSFRRRHFRKTIGDGTGSTEKKGTFFVSNSQPFFFFMFCFFASKRKKKLPENRK